MKSKIIYGIDKIVDIKDSVNKKTENLKEEIRKTSIYNNKLGQFFRKLYNFIYEHLLKHKYMIIPIVILLVLPPGLSILLGLEFCKNPVDNVPTIIVNHDNSSTIQSLIQMIEDNDVFDVVIHSNDDDDIEKYIDNGTAMAGLIIPEDFSDNLLNGKEATILSFVDGSVTSPSSAAKGAISETLGTLKSGYLMKLAEGKFGMTPQNAQNLISPMGYNYRFLGNPTKNMSIFMMEGIVLNCMQIAVAIAGSFISEKKNYIKLIGKGTIIGLLGALSSLICMYTQIKYFNIPYRGTVLGGVLLTLLCNLGWAFFGIIINYSKKGNKVEAASSCGIVSMTMLFSGYTFPVLAMPEFFSKIVNFMPNTHFIIPLRDISLLGFTYDDVSVHVIWLLKFALLMVALVTLQFVLSKIPKREKSSKAKGNVNDEKEVLEDIHGIDSNNGQLVKVNNKGGVQ